MWVKLKNHSGFTIVELLVVIVVIGILAAVTIVAYNGVQERARQSTISSDFSNNNKIAKLAEATTGNAVTTASVLQSDSKLAFTKNFYKLFSFCASNQGYLFAAETLSGDRYYSKNGGTSVKDNTIDVTNPCPAQSINSADKVFLGTSASACAVENGSCTFSGTSSVAYGSVIAGKMNIKTDLTSPVACTNAFFGDPATGYTKSCYLLNY